MLDDATRPSRFRPADAASYSRVGRAVGQHLIEVHDHLRAELTELVDVIDQVRTGHRGGEVARSAISDMTLRQNNWTMGAYCASYCRLVTQHHGLEDASVFPHLRAGEPELTPVLDRLEEEHVVIHGLLDDVDRALVEFINAPDDFTGLQVAVDLLADRLLSHLSYEERELVDPLARLGFYPGQV